ncbi:uncharacterized protein K452DRAFT_284383 [Aplosporella prunicola CBS 121167]|uniref:Nuclear control of ATPase protein 2 n=1 Tax=Aplosporella prunicola CBS 121167 TaxID=1176127 RepID=A0A6A6BP40_9PEZI|nr:uncharacterized protein K452DRAFT_284383 [Aplosporella prunicola CBS 121167]KAF2144994.1 hypothetical protein K452DRAFT_284383 [Aplosporella prunicola CBS 121167]
MSFVVDQVRRIDSQLDRVQLSGLRRAGTSAAVAAAAAAAAATTTDSSPQDSARIQHLQKLIKSLSVSAATKHGALLSRDRLHAVLRQAQIAAAAGHQHDDDDVRAAGAATLSYERELEWLLLSKAAAHTYGLVLSTILDQTLPLNDDIWYWDDVLGSYRAAGLYSVQTSPGRLWGWTKDVYQDVKRRGGGLRDGWGQFYGLVQEVVQERSIANIQRKVLSPLALVRNEARRKQSVLKRIRLTNANALGVLLGEGLSHHSAHAEGFRSPTAASEDGQHLWKDAITRSIALMDIVLQELVEPEGADDFDNAVATRTENDEYYQILESGDAHGSDALSTSMVAGRLINIVEKHLGGYSTELKARSKEHGRPSRLVRYWLPATALLISSTTIYRIVMNKRAEILTWIMELGRTTIDFWTNWVVEPVKKIVGTIRHDEGSEVSIMSKRSLEGDRDSLERMVVDFAVQNPENGSLNDAQIAEVRIKVREGDLTPVLKAYEKDMQKPIIGAITGSLIRALLIQVQKTKVDVEVAMSGIDSILKSQELLFGFIGLTPGVMVCFGVTRWLQGTFGNRKGLRKTQVTSQVTRMFRNIDRILVAAQPNKYGELYYKDHGLLLCEVHTLRQLANRVLPARVFQDFLEEVDDLVDIRSGVKKQRKVLKRMRWAYAKWLARP